MTIDGRDYDLGRGGITTIAPPHNVTINHPVDMVFTAHTTADIIHFTIYLNLHGGDVGYINSDTYISYDHGVVEIYDPHGFIHNATITITEDSQQAAKKIINAVIDFDDEMGLTNMVVYLWNADRSPVFIRIIDVLDITSEPEISDVGDDEDTQSTTSGRSSDAHILYIIRIWAGFEQGSVTDDELLRELGLDYQGVHIPKWIMTELGVLASKGSITVDEFVTSLVYVLDNY